MTYKTDCLITWIGFHDLEKELMSTNEKAPIETILNTKHYNIKKVVLIYDKQHHKKEWRYQSVKEYADDFKKKYPDKELIREEIEEIKASQLLQVFEQSLAIMRKLSSEKEFENCNLLYNTSSGTQSMAISWVFISYEAFPGTLLQTYHNKTKDESLSEPFSIPDEVDISLARIKDLVRNKERILKVGAGFSIIGEDPKFKTVIDQAFRTSLYDSLNTLIIGETGTGKEAIAQLIFDQSTRKKTGKFIDFNMATLSESLIESELFGYVEGAFTGAKKKGKTGLFKRADKGVLFLDEIGDMPLNLQPKLLRAIQEGSFTALGSEQSEKVDVRFISATNCYNKLRNDLFYRLAETIIEIPPLRDRGNDVILLAEYFLEKYNEVFSQENKQYVKKAYHPDAYDFFKSYEWEGNVRELQTVLKRCCALDDCREINRRLIEKYVFHRMRYEEVCKNEISLPLQKDLKININTTLKSIDLNSEMKRLKYKTISEVIRLKGSQRNAAPFLRMKSTALSKWLKENSDSVDTE